ncbi:pilus assembly protein [Duganella sp. FT3S]|uniref:Pilus assembly protein n=1 Tax=Rugamonas fusca TaxID=2758568 RepID=A0A7W2I831_9BURK|nr:TadE/TadG family type IV pilus assembly protein [Rugamonas fusca]MBA5606933.1 pilus assembly protein [Rugamonas fusca]
MNANCPCKATAHQRGIAALEFAIILPFIMILLAFPLLFGRAFVCYTVAREAARDAAVYLSTVPKLSLSNSARTSNEVAVANSIVAMELAGLYPGPSAPSVSIQCDGLTCDGFSIPATIRVAIRVNLIDEIFQSFTSSVTGDNGLLLTADITMRYVGN